MVLTIVLAVTSANAIARQQQPPTAGDTIPPDIDIDRAALPEAAHRSIEALDVRSVDLRDLLRGIGAEYGLNLIVDDGLSRTATVRLVDLPVIDVLVFLAEEYGLSLRQSGGVFRIRPAAAPPPPEPTPPPAPDVRVAEGLLSVDLTGQDVSDVIRALSLHSDANLVVRPGVSGPVHGILREVPFERGVRALLEANGFVLRLRDGIYHVEADRRTAARESSDSTDGRERGYWVNVSDAGIAFDVVDAPIADIVRDIASQADLSLISYHAPDGAITARAVVRTVEEAFDLLLRGTESTYRRHGEVFIIGDRSAAGIATSRLIRLGHLQAARVLEILPETVRNRATVDLVAEHNGLMVTGSRDVIAEIADVVVELDHPTPQILIEALVVDFEGFNVFDLGVTFGRDGPRSADYAGGYYSWGDGPDQRGGFDIRGGGADANEALDRVRDAGHRIGAGDVVQWIGRLPDDFFIRIRALAAEGKAEVRSRPQISTLNGHEASLTIGTTQYFILRTATPISSPTEVFVQETERFEKIEANVTLRVLPWVSAHGEVTAEIRPEFSTPVGTFDPAVPPTINTRVLESTVRLRDGETIILGGMIQDAEVVHHNKIPILGSIPILGALFRNRARDTRTSELVIFLTPHVFYGDDRDAAKWRDMQHRLGVDAPVFEPVDAPRGWSGSRFGPSRDLYGPRVPNGEADDTSALATDDHEASIPDEHGDLDAGDLHEDSSDGHDAD